MSTRLLIRLASTGRSVLLPRTSSTSNSFKSNNNNCCFQPPRRTEVTTPSGGIVREPERVSFGLFYVGLTIVVGLIIGATISKNMANFLEENEIFAPADDDDDD